MVLVNAQKNNFKLVIDAFNSFPNHTNCEIDVISFNSDYEIISFLCYNNRIIDVERKSIEVIRLKLNEIEFKN